MGAKAPQPIPEEFTQRRPTDGSLANKCDDPRNAQAGYNGPLSAKTDSMPIPSPPPPPPKK